MKKQSLKEWAKSNAAHLTVTEYNTNNAWGFGGSSGKLYTLPDGKTFIRIGRASTRHAGTFPVAYAGVSYGPSAGSFVRLTEDEFFQHVQKLILRINLTDVSAPDILSHE